MIQGIGATADRIFRCPLDPGGKIILEKISLDVKPGEFLCNVCASGCGRTTALRLAAGLYQPTGGTVSFDARLPGWPPIGYLTALAMSFVEKRLLKWRWSGH
jgi:NitT/TauT family transport system ATP-binding protein